MKQFFVILVAIASAFADPTVTINDGTIKGHVLTTNRNGVSYYAYQGIPYAAPPVGSLRFQAPTAPTPWSGVLEATKESNMCYQVKYDYSTESEDCLYVNVFSPVDPSQITEALPVMFWIYGGAFRGGSSGYSTYGPDYFIEQGIIVVTHNYRLGPFGFLATGDLVAPGNAGLKDQTFALKWTYDNIAKFGGDPSKITIFGESAGSASVGYQLLSKLSSGLFRASIQESGSPLNEWAYLSTPKDYTINLASIVSGGSFTDQTSEGLLQYLQSVDASLIDQASKNTTPALALPVIEPEHDGAFISSSMYELFESGNFNQVPHIIGCNSEEYAILAKSSGTLKVLGRSFDSNPQYLVPSNIPLADGVDRASLGSTIKNIYLGDGETWADNPGPLIRWYSDSGFTRGIIKQAKLAAKYTSVYFYQFSYDGELGGWDYSVENAEKVSHGEDLRYLFVRRGNPDTSDLSKFPAEDVLTLERMVQLWSNFAKTMNPTPESEELLQNVIWPTVDPDNYQYLNINVSLEVSTNPKGNYYKKWETVFGKYAVGTLVTY